MDVNFAAGRGGTPPRSGWAARIARRQAAGLNRRPTPARNILTPEQRSASAVEQAGGLLAKGEGGGRGSLCNSRRLHCQFTSQRSSTARAGRMHGSTVAPTHSLTRGTTAAAAAAAARARGTSRRPRHLASISRRTARPTCPAGGRPDRPANHILPCFHGAAAASFSLFSLVTRNNHLTPRSYCRPAAQIPPKAGPLCSVQRDAAASPAPSTT